MELRYRGLAESCQILSKSCPNYAIVTIGVLGWRIAQQALHLA